MEDRLLLAMFGALIGGLQAIALFVLAEIVREVRGLRKELAPLKAWAQSQGFEAAKWT